MSSRFGRFTGASAATTPLLPLVHTTDFYVFRDIMEVSPELKASLCGVYNENLLYLFYGKPCYRPHQDVEPTSLSAFYLVSLLFEPGSISSVQRILPFDSGAFKKKLFHNSIYPRMPIEDFELGSDVNAAARVVGAFYGSNKNYFDEILRKDISYGRRDLEIEAYISIVQTHATTPFDDRRSAIEIQLSQSLDLLKAKVLAVILPEAFLDDDVTADFIENTLGAEALGYPCAHARPLEDARSILTEAKRFYRRKGFI